jgi:glutaconate CoA-transferase subunit B
MQVLSLHPGKTLQQVQAATGFKVDAAPNLTETPTPSEAELSLLREEVDPLGYVLRRGG